MRILIVDDEEGFLNIMSEVLKDAGHTVTMAGNGKQAREALEQENMDAIVSDVFMPTLDGVRFHSYVREFMADTTIPFIFISGHDNKETRALVNPSERDYFISKTDPVESIIKLIDSLSVPFSRPTA
jgi:CheY-like chemotaxis protein